MAPRIRPASAVALTFAALALAGCAFDAAPEPTPVETGSTQPPAPAPEPVADDPTQVGVLTLNPDGRDAFSQGVTGPALFTPLAEVRVDGWCSGGSITYSVVTASVDVERRVLFGSSFDCGDAMHESTVAGIDYAGPVQVIVDDADEIVTGWVQVRQAAA